MCRLLYTPHAQHILLTSFLVSQAIGVPPNVASAEALLQASRSCTHLSDRVKQLIAPFQPALAAAQLSQASLPSDLRFANPLLAAAQMLPENRFPTTFTDAAQNMLAGPSASSLLAPSTTHAVPGWQAESGMASEQKSHDQSFGQGMLPPAVASAVNESSGSLPAAPEKETLEPAPGSGPPTAAPVTPVARSESAEASSSCSL